MARTVRINSPAPTSNISASATSPATSAPRYRAEIPLDPDRPPCVKASFTLRRPASNAGASPKTIAVSSAIATVNASVHGSRCRSCRCAESTGASVSIARIPQYANSNPHAPAATLSRRLSVNICRINRQRVAPSASRTASSLRRPMARASIRFATLAQAINKTNPTAPCNSRT